MSLMLLILVGIREMGNQAGITRTIETNKENRKRDVEEDPRSRETLMN